MKLSSRKFVFCLLTLAFVALSSAAQETRRIQPAAQPSPAASPARSENETEETERELTPDERRALYALDELRETANRFDDERDRIRTLAQIADLRFAHDAARARSEFEDAFRRIESIRPPAAGSSMSEGLSSAFGVSALSQLRVEILRLVARRDAELAGRLARTVAEPQPAQPSTQSPANATNERSPFGNQSERSGLYLQMALSLVETDVVRAAEFARMSLQAGEIHFLLPAALFSVRAKNGAAADAVYREAFNLAQRDESRALFRITLLASYVFPDYGGGGRMIRMMAGDNAELSAAMQTNPTLAREFLNFAYNVIMRSGNRPAAASPSFDSEATTLQMFGAQLLPFFEQYAPERAGAVRARLDAQLQNVPAGRMREMLTTMREQNSVSDWTRRAERATTPAERDVNYLQAISVAASEEDFDQAISLSERLSNEEMRPLIASTTRLQAVMFYMSRREWEAAHRRAREIPDAMMRATAFAMLAQKLVEYGDEVRAREILTEAARLLRSAETTPDKAHALLLIAGVEARLDTLRGFEAMETAIAAVNTVEAASPATNSANASSISSVMRSMASMFGGAGQSFDFNQNLTVLARADLERALGLARAVRKTETSVAAQLAVYRGVLDERERPRAAR